MRQLAKKDLLTFVTKWQVYHFCNDYKTWEHYRDFDNEDDAVSALPDEVPHVVFSVSFKQLKLVLPEDPDEYEGPDPEDIRDSVD